MPCIDVFVASHDPSFCAEAQCALSTDPEVRVVGSADERQYGYNNTNGTRTNSVLVLDYQNPYLQATNRLPGLRAFPNSARTLLVSDAAVTEFTEDLFAYGYRGMISRGAMGGDLVKAVRGVAAGELWIERRMLARLLERATERRVEKTIPVAMSLHSALTVRENTIASYAARGFMNKEIARALSISDMTVKTHMSRILHKLGLARRQQLVFGTSDRQSLRLPASTRTPT